MTDDDTTSTSHVNERMVNLHRYIQYNQHVNTAVLQVSRYCECFPTVQTAQVFLLKSFVVC